MRTMLHRNASVPKPQRMHGCKILQLYEYEAIKYGYKANCEWYLNKTS